MTDTTNTTVPASFERPLGEAAEVATAIAASPETPKPLATAATDVAEAATDTAAGNGTSSVVTGLIRTATPLGVAAVISYFATKGINVPAADDALIATAGTFAVGSVYYFIVRKLEGKWPKLGWLLGHPSAPVYPA